MNERIRELAEQAGCKVMDDGEWYIPSAAGLEKVVYTSGVGLEKFAELIIAECIDVFSKDLPDTTSPDYQLGSLPEVVNRIANVAEHFRVEE